MFTSGSSAGNEDNMGPVKSTTSQMGTQSNPLGPDDVTINHDSDSFACVGPFAAAAEPEAEHDLTDWLGARISIRDDSHFRSGWSVLLGFAMLYVATLMPYQLCFMEFRVPTQLQPFAGWEIVSYIVDGFFWCDLVLNFFMTYRDFHGREVTRFSRIAKRYLCGGFAVDLISCLPAFTFEEILLQITDKASNSSTNKAARLSRLHRLPKLVRIIRILRLARVFRFVEESFVWRRLSKFRGFKEINFVIGFFIVAHLLSCGWYLVAALHANFESTWVYRRHEQAGFLDEDPRVQWLHSLYFVLTVFTTVGFGDMSAFTNAEMVYCIFTMIVGTLANSMIMGQVINIMSASDQVSLLRQEQTTLMSNFAEHTQLDQKTAVKFHRFLRVTESVHRGYDRQQVKMLMSRSVFPRELMGELPGALFRGQLVRNQMLITACLRGNVPMRLPLYIALAAHQRFLVGGDLVYCVGDQPAGVHLVMNGVFTGIATRKGRPTAEPERLVSSATRYKHLSKEAKPGEFYPYQIFCRRSYFGDTEVLLGQPARKHSIRCDSDGSMLIFDKNDLAELQLEFPNHIWVLAKVAQRRYKATKLLRKGYQAYYSQYVDLAAFCIQRRWRDLVSKGKSTNLANKMRTSRNRMQSHAIYLQRLACLSLHKVRHDWLSAL